MEAFETSDESHAIEIMLFTCENRRVVLGGGTDGVKAMCLSNLRQEEAARECREWLREALWLMKSAISENKIGAFP